MLFDLQGRRRRMVQGTYLILAILMGGGLVLFGVGSGSISGGLFDALTGKNSNSSSRGSSIVAKRVKADERALRLNPKNTTALADLVRAHYQLAGNDEDQTTGVFGSDGKAELRQASAAWQRYITIAKNPDSSLAALMLQAYSEIGLNQPGNATDAATIFAAAKPSAAAYLRVAQYAQKAGRTAVADRAGQKAIDLAPKNQKKLVQKQLAIVRAQAVVGPNSVKSGSGG
jgi:hypothetical protein